MQQATLLAGVVDGFFHIQLLLHSVLLGVTAEPPEGHLKLPDGLAAHSDSVGVGAGVAEGGDAVGAYVVVAAVVFTALGFQTVPELFLNVLPGPAAHFVCDVFCCLADDAGAVAGGVVHPVHELVRNLVFSAGFHVADDILEVVQKRFLKLVVLCFRFAQDGTAQGKQTVDGAAVELHLQRLL